LLLYHWNLDACAPPAPRDPAQPALSLAQARLSFGSSLVTLFTRRAAVKTQVTRNRQILTRGPKDVTPKAKGPESVTTVHSQPHRQMRRLEPSPSRLRILPRPSSHSSSLLSLRSPLQQDLFFFSFLLQISTSACRTLHTMRLLVFFGSGPLRGAHRHGRRIGWGRR
jgi:hypothetical protein